MRRRPAPTSVAASTPSPTVTTASATFAGSGLFLGIELVEDRATRQPATDATHRVLDAVRHDGLLLSAEGPGHNVLKIKPPLAFDRHDADLLLGAVDRALGDLT